MVQYISTTQNIDQRTITIDKAICRHIAEFGTSPRGAVSQDVLAQLRNFVDHGEILCPLYFSTELNYFRLLEKTVYGLSFVSALSFI